MSKNSDVHTRKSESNSDVHMIYVGIIMHMILTGNSPKGKPINKYNKNSVVKMEKTPHSVIHHHIDFALTTKQAIESL